MSLNYEIDVYENPYRLRRFKAVVTGSSQLHSSVAGKFYARTQEKAYNKALKYLDRVRKYDRENVWTRVGP